MSDYQTLQGAIASYLDVEGDETAAMIPDFIRIQQNNIDREFRLMEQQASATLTGDNTAYVDLPADYIALKTLRPSSWDGTLNQVAPGAFVRLLGGQPDSYAIELMKVEFNAPLSDESTVAITYYARLPALVNPTDTNWFIQTAWGVVLYGSLLQSVPFLRETEASTISAWDTAYKRAYSSLKTYEHKQRRVAGRQIATMRYQTP